MNKQTKSLLTVGILVLFVGFITSLFVFKQKEVKVVLAPKAATVFNTARTIDHFDLVDQDNKPFTQANLENHWSLLFFGFTRCDSICPTTMAVLKQVYEKLPNATHDPAQVVFVTVDPEYDNPEILKKYVDSFNENFIGVTGSEQELTQLQHSLGIMAMPAVTHTGNEHMIDHSGTIIVTNPQGEFYALFTAPHNADAIVDDYQNLTSYYYQQNQGQNA